MVLMEHVKCDGEHDEGTSCVRVDVPIKIEPLVLARQGKYVRLVAHVFLFGSGGLRVDSVHVERLER